MRIMVKPQTGTRFRMNVARSDTIAMVKQQILTDCDPSDHPVPTQLQRLAWGRTKLDDGRTLADYNIEDGAIITMKWSKNALAAIEYMEKPFEWERLSLRPLVCRGFKKLIKNQSRQA
jgi:hypothetical protein